jgi:beta-mannosidase
LIDNAVAANMNMVRVWGGAIYEEDYFYELCDQKGILVWQDFMFACALQPGDEAHLDNIRREAEYNVKRLRNHASIALWCGNNENLHGLLHWWNDMFSPEVPMVMHLPTANRAMSTTGPSGLGSSLFQPMARMFLVL